MVAAHPIGLIDFDSNALGYDGSMNNVPPRTQTRNTKKHTPGKYPCSQIVDSPWIRAVFSDLLYLLGSGSDR